MKKKFEMNYPSWLFFPILGTHKINDWTDEKEKLAKEILKSLKNHFPQDYERLAWYDKNDNLTGYMMKEITYL